MLRIHSVQIYVDMKCEIISLIKNADTSNNLLCSSTHNAWNEERAP